MSENKYKRGSEWRKWDLHVHSPYTKLNNQFSNCTDNEFIETIKEKGIKAIGLTNYFKFDKSDYKLKTKLEKKGITTFLNLELRLTYQNKENQCCDLHIIFSNDIEKETIQSFLINLTLKVGHEKKKATQLSNNDDFEKATVELEHLIG